MDGFFYPNSIAVVGASRNKEKIGYKILENIIKSGFHGKIYPVNPFADEILGRKCFKSVEELPSTDLAIISIPAEKAINALEECGKKGIKHVIVISSGFKEVGNRDLENKLIKTAKKYGIRVIGPNVFGIVYTPSSLNATFGNDIPEKGKIAVITQSGALGVAMMGWTKEEKKGVSAIVGVGNKADVDEADLIDFLGNDENTDVILLYIEGIKNGRKFMDSVKRCRKPIVAIKAGKTKAGASAASTHTGSLAGDDTIYNGVFRQVGIIRAEDIKDAFSISRALLTKKVPPSESVLIVTNGGGIGVMAADMCESSKIALYRGKDLKRFGRVIPSFGSFRNPVDLTGQAKPEDYAKALEIADETEAGVILCLFCETAVCNPHLLVKKIWTTNVEKPIVFAGFGGRKTKEAIRRMDEKIPAFENLRNAVAGVRGLIEWKTFLRKRSE